MPLTHQNRAPAHQKGRGPVQQLQRVEGTGRRLPGTVWAQARSYA